MSCYVALELPTDSDEEPKNQASRQETVERNAAASAAEGFLSAGGTPQRRYELLRSQMASYRSEEEVPTETWEEELKCCWQRLKRYGFLGLLDADPAGSRWRTVSLEGRLPHVWIVEVLAVERRYASARWSAAYSLLWAKAQEELGSGSAVQPTSRRERA